MRRNRLKSLRLVNCGPRNKVTFYVFEAVPFSALSLLSSVVVLELSSCCPPLLNNMLERPKAESFPNAFLTAGCAHQGHGGGRTHSLIPDWAPEVHQKSTLPCHRPLSNMSCLRASLREADVTGR